MKKMFLAIVSVCWMMSAAYANEVPSPGADVTLQPGDVLQINLPGESAFDSPIQIDREGMLSLPEAEAVKLSGLKVPVARELILSSLGAVYRDLERLTIKLIDRRLSVAVHGYVKNPGQVDLPEHATVQMAVEAAGGIKEGAQLDRLQVRRGEDVIVFDFKKYLDSGDPSAIPPLRPLDIVFVPASPLTGNVQVEFDARTLTAAGDAADDGSSVKVFGEVHRPGLFGYKESADVVDVLMRAGGVTRYAGVEQIRLFLISCLECLRLPTYSHTAG